ncbi:MAG: VOC family protein [Deltaproteobacteria bacterium]|nr:VOC family protein [Deltaproteobacteria bacterium]
MIRTTIQPSHVAIIVPSVRKAADYLRQFNFEISKEEEWDGEGTKEIYIERSKANSLLLMEPIKPGAYQRAMEKRGPGLHHLAIEVLNLESYLESLTGSGWLLHPISIKTMKQFQTVYLARTGFPALIEVHEKELLTQCQIFVEKVSIPMDPALFGLLKYIGSEGIVKPSSEPPKLLLGGRSIELKALFLS